MDEAEAEAVLLALGSPLEWIEGEQGTHTGQKDDTLYYVVPVRLYAAPVHSDKDALLVTQYKHPKQIWNRANERCPVAFRSVPEAKAACECHYTTGTWE